MGIRLRAIAERQIYRARRLLECGAVDEGGETMPVEFVTAEQERQYGRYTGEPSETELAQYFYLDADDWDLLGERRGDHNRLSFVM